MRRTAAGLLVALSLACAACTSPPEKEMNQARGAIAAARAAGADVYATNDYQAAMSALRRSEDAAAQRDYRQALNYALDSREQAENAARNAADGKAAARSQAEREVHDLQVTLEQARERLKAAQAATKAGRRLTASERRARAAADASTVRAIEAADASVQKARTSLAREDYAGALAAVSGVSDQLRAAIQQIAQATPASPVRRRR